TDTTSASRHQAVTSSTAAQASEMTPMRVVWMRRSVRMRASTGNAVTDMDTPRNSAKQLNGTSLDENRGYKESARVQPNRNGAMMLACEMATVAWPRLRNRPGSSSRPTRNM